MHKPLWIIQKMTVDRTTKIPIIRSVKGDSPRDRPSPARDRKRYTMTKQNAITRADALAIAIERVADMPEVAEVLTKMHASITKPRAKSEGPSKARKDNERLAHELAAAIPEGSEVTAKWVTEHVRGVLTTQKAAAVARVGVELGIISKVVDGRKVTYARA